MRKLARALIRTSAFLRKEIVNILRQPRLILALVLGPFLILFIFGIGAKEEAPPLKTLFVATQDNVLRPYIEKYATTVGAQLKFAGITENREAALTHLRQGTVDTVIIVPQGAASTLQQGQQAIFHIYHTEIMPTRAEYVEFTMSLYLDVTNRRILRTLIKEEQTQISEITANIHAAQTNLEQLSSARTREEPLVFSQQLLELDQNLQRTIDIVEGTKTTSATSPSLPARQTWLTSALYILQMIQGDVQFLHDIAAEDLDLFAPTFARIQQGLGKMESLLDNVNDMEADVVVQPFDSKAENLEAIDLHLMDFYTPAVIALLLQHLCITFGALSIVQEDLVGATELFEIAPLSAAEILLGKYLSYLLFSGLITGVLTLLSVHILGVPMLGSWEDYVLAMTAVIFASLGLGFLVSLLSKSIGQAVQVSMLLLLASVFFTGFLRDLESLRSWVQAISWSLPATYGVQFLQNIMLRGRSFDTQIWLRLIGGSCALFILNWWLLRRHLVKD